MIRRVEITSPSRLHFGLYGFGATQERQFGGIGAMINTPSVRLVASAANQFAVQGPLSARVQAFARRWSEFHRRAELPACSIEVQEVPPEHTGLGVGTQLGLSVAMALHTLAEFAPPTPRELALSVGRGLRSAVGTYGFLRGGFIAERGKLPSESFAPLDVRVELPTAWRFVLVTPLLQDGLHGTHEMQAFSQLPPVSPLVTEQLICLVRERLVPAAVTADFQQFSEAMYQYCHAAGECFAPIQGGPYNGSMLMELVRTIRELGVTGIGQSSWGPTLFCLLPDQTTAETFARQLQPQCAGDTQIHITSPNNSGVRVLV